jgi:hypothetical protein
MAQPATRGDAVNVALLALAAVLLGAALQVRDGLYSPWAVGLLTLASVATFLSPLPILRERARVRAVELTCAFGLLFQLTLLFTDFPGAHYEKHPPRDYWPFLALIAAALASAVLMIRFAEPAFLVLLAIYLAAGAWVIRFTPSPRMDVYTFQRDACESILHGVNPYSITYPNVNGPDGAWVYGPGLVKDDRLLFGLPYMPVTLAWDLIGHVVAGDYRWMQLAAVAIAAVCVASLGWTRVSMLAAAILLFTPRGFYILEQGWTEPLLVMLLAATVCGATRGWRATPFLLGLLVAGKQYNVFVLALVPLLGPRITAGFVVKMLATAVVVTLPLAVWDVRSFWHSAVALQFAQPFRMDSLSFAAWIANREWGRAPEWLALVAAAVVAGACLVRCKRSPAGFAFAITTTYLTFFAVNKQAFANYYFYVIGGMCVTIGLIAKPQAAVGGDSCLWGETSDNKG